MRITARIAGLSIVTCILFFVACSSDDAPGAGGTEDGDGGSSGKSSSGTSSGTSGQASSGNASSSGDGGDPDAEVLVPVGDGSLGAGCNKDSECNSKVCGAGHKCVSAPSCRPSTGSAPGVDTCGAAEPGGESCCTTLTLPTTTTRTLDKFEITAGRIRAFMSALPDGNLKKYAKDFATAHPTSELGKLATEFPTYLDTLPDHAGATGDAAQLPIWLGAFPQDAMNKYDGCYVGPGIFGAATYWQEPAVLKTYGIGYGPADNPDGTRKYPASTLDTKPANCMPPVLLATFCAWDGGELARTSDYYEIWGHTTTTLPGGTTKFTSPWTTILKPGEFNWRNGHGTTCPVGWPGCVDATEDNPPPTFFSFPKGGNSADDDAPEIGAPGRFPKDVTAVKSPEGSGWMDVGGNLLEAAWPKTNGSFKTAVQNFCNTYAGGSPGDPGFCNRDQAAIPGGDGPEARPGALLFSGQPPTVALIGASFEGHITYGENYFAVTPEDETKLAGYGFPVHFQYGKVGGRCARTK